MAPHRRVPGCGWACRRRYGSACVVVPGPKSAPVVTVSRPVGGVLYVARGRRGGHPSMRPTWGVRLRGAAGRAARPLFGLAPGGVCRAVRVTPGAGALLPHRFTLTCAREGHRRSVFCGTFLRVTPTGRQPP